MSDKLELVVVDNEPITRIMDVNDLVREHEIKRLKARKAVSKGTTLVLMAVTALASIYGTLRYKKSEKDHYLSRLAEQAAHYESKIADIKDSLFTADDFDRYAELKKQLAAKVENTKDFLNKTADSETRFAEMAGLCNNYIEKSKPAGELEETAALEIAAMQMFFSSYSSENVMKPVMECHCAAEEALQKNLATRKDLEKFGSKVDAMYISAFNKIRQQSEFIVENLSGFREYAEAAPLKQRQEMLDKIDSEIASRNQLIAETDKYSQVFAVH